MPNRLLPYTAASIHQCWLVITKGINMTNAKVELMRRSIVHIVNVSRCNGVFLTMAIRKLTAHILYASDLESKSRIRHKLMTKSDKYLKEVGVSRKLLEQGVDNWPWGADCEPANPLTHKHG